MGILQRGVHKTYVGVVDVVSANLNDNVPVNAGSRGLGEHGVLAPDGLLQTL